MVRAGLFQRGFLRNETHISWVIWYAQKLNALPAHSMMIFGLKPLNTLVL